MKRMMMPLLLLLFACATGMNSGVDATIRGQADMFDSAMRAGNVDGFMAMYADDAILMPPNAPAATGSAAVRQFWSGLLAAGATDVDLIVDQVTVSGDLAIDRGRYELTKPFRDSGKYVVVWQNRGGKWLIIHDIFNSSLPLPGSG